VSDVTARLTRPREARGEGQLTAVSLFAGIEGFGLALERCGVNVTVSVEIDAECRGVIGRHFPGAKLFDDVRKVTANDLRAAGFVPARGILTGGFPCQDLSIAGRRAGLGGARSGLFWEIVRLADELSPRWLILENVPGLLSAVCSCPGDETCVDNGRAVRCGRWDKRDGQRVWLAHVAHTPEEGACPGGCMELHGGAMGTILGALGNLGYGFAYRVLDAQFFGVPQRRERVFIVGCLGDWAAPVEILFDPAGCERNPAPRGQAGADVAGTLGSRAGGSRTTDLDGHGAYIAATLQAGANGRGHRIDAEGAAGGHLVAVAFSENQRAELVETPIAHQLTTGGGKPGQGYSAVRTATAVRRLTPLERERLQGFPDDWTRWRLDASGNEVEQSDSARDRQTGNAVAVPVVEWIASRLVAADLARGSEAGAA
jgi:DNA (cytosine-5)-methyltransferase 1